MTRHVLVALTLVTVMQGCMLLPSKPKEIALPFDAVVLGKRQSVKIAATPIDGDGQAMEDPVFWETTDPGVVRVSEEGDVLAVDSGSATVHLRVGKDVRDSITVTVVERLAVKVEQVEAVPVQLEGGACQYTLRATGVGGPPGDSAVWSGGALEFIDEADTLAVIPIEQGDMADRFGRLVVRRDDTLTTRRLAVTSRPGYRVVNRVRYTVGEEMRSVGVAIDCPVVDSTTTKTKVREDLEQIR